MQEWQAILWGVGGTLAFEASIFFRQIARSAASGARFPLVAAGIFLRTCVAAFIVAAFASAGQINTAPIAVLVGIAAPQVVARLGSLIELAPPPRGPVPSKESGLTEAELDAYLKEGERELDQKRSPGSQTGGQ